MSSTNIALVFLGTGSAQPSPTRNHSALAVLVDGRAWLFDCGEGTQHQIGRSPSCRLSRIRRIFVTHLHGDHIFGIPGLMCSIAGQVGAGADFHLQLYGPRGLRQFIRSALRCSYSRLTFKYSVHELHVDDDDSSQVVELHDDEVVGEDLHPLVDGGWRVCSARGIAVVASPIVHLVPCVGYVLTEETTPGRLMIEKIAPILQHHQGALSVRNPLSLLAAFKTGTAIALPDGTTLTPDEFLEAPKRGRKIVILGDTSDPSAIASMATGADVLVHEATNAFVRADRQTTTAEATRELCKAHGHSTPEMAGEFARRVGAVALILNHFSSRYRGDDDATMEEIRQLAIGTFGSSFVATAADLMTITIHRGRNPLADAHEHGS